MWPYVKRQKNDATDAEAMRGGHRPTCGSCDQTRAAERLVLHHRHLFIRQQTSAINAIRAHLAELGSLRRSGARRRGAAHSSPTNDRRFQEPVRVSALGAQLRVKGNAGSTG
jgi:transposase